MRRSLSLTNTTKAPHPVCFQIQEIHAPMHVMLVKNKENILTFDINGTIVDNIAVTQAITFKSDTFGNAVHCRHLREQLGFPVFRSEVNYYVVMNSLIIGALCINDIKNEISFSCKPSIKWVVEEYEPKSMFGFVSDSNLSDALDSMGLYNFADIRKLYATNPEFETLE